MLIFGSFSMLRVSQNAKSHSMIISETEIETETTETETETETAVIHGP